MSFNLAPPNLNFWLRHYLYVDPGVDVKEEEGKHEEEAFSMAIEEAIGGIYIKTQQSLWVSSGTNLSQRSEIETHVSKSELVLIGTSL